MRVKREIYLSPCGQGDGAAQFHFQVVGKTSVLFCLSSLHLILAYGCYDDLSNFFFLAKTYAPLAVMVNFCCI